jgi:flagellar hook assembly protein FlgD
VVSGPAVHCSEATTDVPVGHGTVLVSSTPNPYQKRVSFHFSLPQAGRVVVQVFSADGRLVDTVTDGEMSAGPHAIEWKAASSVRSGVYFYKVLANGRESSGKFVRVD